MYIKLIACGVALSFTVFAVSAAEIDSSAGNYDYKSYSAAGCGAQVTNAKIKINPNGSIANYGTTSNTITCPTIGDRLATGSPRYYQILVYRATGAGNMTCFLTSFRGTTVTTKTQAVTATGVDVAQGFTSNDDGIHSLGCNLPKKVAAGPSLIKYYQVSEN